MRRMNMTDTNTLPAPLTPVDCELRDFKFMPLDVVRLRDSDLAALTSGDEFRCAVLLWCASWHQIPAASLPDDDLLLAQYAGFGRVVKEWQKVRQGALRGWIKCADGRLYHPVVAEKANESWIAKLKQRLKTECARIKKHNERHEMKVPYPEFEDWMAAGCPVGQPLPVAGDKPPLSPGQTGVVPGEKHSKGQGEGQRQGQGQGQLTSKPGTAHPASAQTELDPADQVQPTAAASLSMAMRAFGINSNPGDLRLVALAEQGITPETITAACQEAKASKPNESIGPGYVVKIVERWAKEAAALNAQGANARTKPQTANDRAKEFADRLTGRNRHANRNDDNIIDINERPAGSVG
jgi:hypothetical protein